MEDEELQVGGVTLVLSSRSVASPNERVMPLLIGSLWAVPVPPSFLVMVMSKSSSERESSKRSSSSGF